MKKIIGFCLCCLFTLFLFTASANAASQSFSFYFNGAYVNGSSNGIYYDIGNDNAKVRAQGSWNLVRSSGIGAQSATCSISLKRVKLFGDADFGARSIGTATIANGALRGGYITFDLSWTGDIASDEYYMRTNCTAGTGDTYKSGTGTISWR